jgi:[ribosomal protein S5]-alanine N-acetyltransferase
MELRTERLVGRRPNLDDIDRYHQLLNDPDVALTMGGRRSDEQLQAALARHLDSWERYGYGPCLLYDRETGEFVGRGGLNRVSVLEHDEIEVGYALLPAFWGRGLATELAQEAVRLGFEELAADSIVGFTLPTNLASRRVLEKCGMIFEREFVHYDLLHVFLRVVR